MLGEQRDVPFYSRIEHESLMAESARRCFEMPPILLYRWEKMYQNFSWHLIVSSCFSSTALRWIFVWFVERKKKRVQKRKRIGRICETSLRYMEALRARESNFRHNSKRKLNQPDQIICSIFYGERELLAQICLLLQRGMLNKIKEPPIFVQQCVCSSFLLDFKFNLIRDIAMNNDSQFLMNCNCVLTNVTICVHFSPSKLPQARLEILSCVIDVAQWA